MASLNPSESIIEPDLPIIDTHHHLWFVTETFLAQAKASGSLASRTLDCVRDRNGRYLFDELLSDFGSGHNIRASVFVEGHMLYRAAGPEQLKPVGEVEVANGVAALSASGLFGEARACAGIVGGVNLSLGDAVEEVLAAHLQAGGARYRGVRDGKIVYDEDETIFGRMNRQHVLLDKAFRAGFKYLKPLGLSFDVFLLEPQLPDLIDLARAFPETQIILNHVGGPIGIGRYEGKRKERFPIWRENMRTLSRCENVNVKLGGLGMPMCGFESSDFSRSATSVELAEAWKPYIENCIDAFGAQRCMFESNFPVDLATCTYATLWNAFKRITAGASQEEKAALFGGTAKRVYRLDV